MERYRELRGKALLFLSFLWFLWFINFGVRIIFAPILPLIEDEFLISHAKASSVFMFQSAGYGVSLIFSGIYAGRIGYKKSIVVSLCISSLVFFLIPFVKIFSVLYFFSFILGFAIGLYPPSAIPLITQRLAEKNWGKSFAIHDSASSISILCIPFISVFLLHFVNWRGIFALFAIVFLASAVIFSLTIDELKIRRSQKALLGNIVKTGPFWKLTTLWILASGTTLGVYFMVPLYLTKEQSMGIEYANSLLGVSRIGSVLVAVASGFFIDRINLRKAMFYMILVTGILTFLIGWLPVRFIGVLLFLQAITVIGFFPVGFLSVAKIFSSEQRSMATGLILALSTLFGGGVVPYLLGLSGDYLSFRVGFMLLGIAASLVSVLTFSMKEIGGSN